MREHCNRLSTLVIYKQYVEYPRIRNSFKSNALRLHVIPKQEIPGNLSAKRKGKCVQLP